MKKVSLFLFVIFCFSCGNQELNPIDYYNWFKSKDNLVVSEQTDDFKFTIELKSPEFMALLSSQVNNQIDEELYKKNLQNYEGQSIFFVKISARDSSTEMLKYKISDDKDYYHRIEYLSTTIKNDFLLVNNSDSLNCSMHIYERNYALTPFEQVILVFDNKLQNNSIDLIYNGELNNNIPINFKFTRSNIKSIPKLNI